MVRGKGKRLSLPLPTIYDFSANATTRSNTSTSTSSSSSSSSPLTSTPSTPTTPFSPSLADDSESSKSLKKLGKRVLTFSSIVDDLIVPKSRKPRFDLTFQIHDLNNVPLVSGAAYVKWQLHNFTRSDSRGRTDKAPIKDHKVTWHYEKTVSDIRMSVDRNGILNEQLVVFEVNQEYSGRERILLGTVTLNLAEYAGVEKETRRYLMQDSKINSTLKISIELTQTSGDANFMAPPLRGAQVFSGIAGIMSNADTQKSQNTKKEVLDFASMTTRNRELSAKQDMYRRTLAASWQLQHDELNAEECIEDIFAGGDGWNTNGNGTPKATPLTPGLVSSASSISSKRQNKTGWWTPQRMSSSSGDSVKHDSIVISHDSDSHKSGGSGGSPTKKHSTDISSDSDSLASIRTGTSGSSIAERRRQKLDGRDSSGARSPAGSERRKPYGMLAVDTGYDTPGYLSRDPSFASAMTSPFRTPRRTSDNSVQQQQQQQKVAIQIPELRQGRGVFVEVDELAAREDLKS